MQRREKATPEAAGLDLHALQDCRVNVHDVQLIETGIGVQIPPEHFGLIAPRSGLALKGIQVLGGVIDADYQGEIKVILKNNGSSDLIVHAGDRIAQLLVIPIYGGKVQKGSAPTSLTERGEAGFGSTNVNNGAKVWVQSPNGPPEQAEIIATGNDSTVLIMKPGQEKWAYVPASKCYLRE
uniref:Deoxyuridine 5'-triphosphate nucleotidohydrolase n=1 Tax=Leptobrachium leishanense TaxID=445787 RepID=A0A8C5MXE5_9ANUR